MADDRLQRLAQTGDRDATEDLLRQAARSGDATLWLKTWELVQDPTWRRRMWTRHSDLAQRCKPGLQWIPAGDAIIGSPANEPGRFHDEFRHPVRLTRSFWMHQSPVTYVEWNELMAPMRYASLMTHHEIDRLTADHPAVFISWFSAIAYCNARSVADGLTPAYTIEDDIGRPGAYGFSAEVKWTAGLDAEGWRLPTEVEWEVACRAGTLGPNWLEDTRLPSTIAWYQDNRPATLPVVKQKAPNPWGLYDMLGLVWEWCWDAYAPYPQRGRVDIDPINSESPLGYRIGRGGSWLSPAFLCRAANRSYWVPTATQPADSRIQKSGFGLRLVRTCKGNEA